MNHPVKNFNFCHPSKGGEFLNNFFDLKMLRQAQHDTAKMYFLLKTD